MPSHHAHGPSVLKSVRSGCHPRRAALLERHITHTSFINSIAFKLTAFFLLNSFVVPIVAVVVITDSADLWYTPGGIVEAGFYIQLINAFVPDLLSVFDAARMVPFHVFSRLARSQSFLTWCRTPPAFSLPSRCAH